MTSKPFIPTKLSAAKMAHLARGAAFDLAANSDDRGATEATIRWLINGRPAKDRLSLALTALHELAAIYAPLLETAEEAAPEGRLRHELAEHATEDYRAAGGR